MILTTLCMTLSPLVPPQGTGVVVFQGSPGQPGDVSVADTTGIVPTQLVPGLSGVTLLDIDFHGRTQLQRFLPDRPRLEQRAPGLSWLTLPNGNGALYRFSRAEIAGGLTFGLLWIDAGGDAHSVFELAGTGANGVVDSFSSRVAVAPAGDTILVSSTIAAGGDLFEVNLAAGNAIDRTSTFAPLDFGTAGLALAPSWAAVACTDRLLRFDRAVSGDAEVVSFGAAGTPAWFSGELALSPMGLHAITVAGGDPLLSDVWVFGPTGDTRLASETPAEISGAGFLPESTHGPYLAVSDDGTRAAWRTTEIVNLEIKREAFMAIVPPPAVPPAAPEQISSDSNYLDTLDEIGEFLFRPLANILLLAVGENSTTGGIESMDLYEADIPSQGNVSIVNLTLTNGIAAPPFIVKSTLNPEDGAYALDSGAVLIHDSQSGGGGDLVCNLPGQPGLQVILPDVKGLDAIEVVGDTAFAVLQRSIGNDDREVWLIPPPARASLPW